MLQLTLLLPGKQAVAAWAWGGGWELLSDTPAWPRQTLMRQLPQPELLSWEQGSAPRTCDTAAGPPLVRSWNGRTVLTVAPPCGLRTPPGIPSPSAQSPLVLDLNGGGWRDGRCCSPPPPVCPSHYLHRVKVMHGTWAWTLGSIWSIPSA